MKRPRNNDNVFVRATSARRGFDRFEPESKDGDYCDEESDCDPSVDRKVLASLADEQGGFFPYDLD